jgi:hypothetical protein
MLILMAWSHDLSAQIGESDADDYFEFLTRANHYSPLEHAGSHGTLGVGIGAGMASYETPAGDLVMQEHWRQTGASVASNQRDSSRVNMGQIHVSKGLPYSLDVGGGFARDSRSNAEFVSGYVQWTGYEAFAMPALALRGQYSRLMGLATTDASAVEASVVVSYGFLRLFTVYGNYGVGRHDMVVRVGPAFGTSLALAGESDGTVGRVLIRQSRSLGMQYQLLPPFCIVAAEYSQVGHGSGSYLAKVSVGM